MDYFCFFIFFTYKFAYLLLLIQNHSIFILLFQSESTNFFECQEFIYIQFNLILYLNKTCFHHQYDLFVLPNIYFQVFHKFIPFIAIPSFDTFCQEFLQMMGLIFVITLFYYCLKFHFKAFQNYLKVIKSIFCHMYCLDLLKQQVFLSVTIEEDSIKLIFKFNWHHGSQKRIYFCLFFVD